MPVCRRRHVRSRAQGRRLQPQDDPSRLERRGVRRDPIEHPQAATGPARVFIVEHVVPEPDVPHFSKLFDIHMMCWGTGRERTEAEYVRCWSELAGSHPVLIIPPIARWGSSLAFVDELRRTSAMKIDGSCHCGHVTFEADADPETTTVCNCTDCQTMSGAPLRAVIMTRPGTFVLLSGKPTDTARLPTAERSAHRDFARSVGPRSIRHRMVMIPKLTTSGSAPFVSAISWCRAGSCLFVRNKRGFTISTRSRSSTDAAAVMIRPIDLIKRRMSPSGSAPRDGRSIDHRAGWPQAWFSQHRQASASCPRDISGSSFSGLV